MIIPADIAHVTKEATAVPDLPAGDPFLQELAKTLTQSRKIIHPDILSRAKDVVEQRELRSFLTGFTGDRDEVLSRRRRLPSRAYIDRIRKGLREDILS